MALTFNLPSQIVVQTAAQWAADNTVYSAKRILVTSDAYYGSTDQRKFKIADGTQTWSNLDYMPIDSITLAQVLANGYKTNGLYITSNNEKASLRAEDTYASTRWDGATYYGQWSAQDANLEAEHDLLIKLNAPTLNITQGTANKTLALDASKNITYIDTLTSANITQTITNGVTDKAPSEDAVFDALALKVNTTDARLDKVCADMLIKTGSTTFDLRYSTNATAFTPSTQTVGRNVMHAMPFIVSETMTFDRIGIEITSAGTAASVGSLLIYDTVDLVPTNLILDAGTVLTDSATYQEITINQQLTAGLYALVFWHNSVANINVRAIPIANCNKVIGISSSIGSGATYTKWTNSETYAAAPSTYPSPTVTNPQTPIITLRRSA
jgi:hypothetical protein